MNHPSEPLNCKALLSQKTVSPTASGKLTFTGVGTRDVYNIAAPFELKGQHIIAGRVESRDTEHSESVFFAPHPPTAPALDDTEKPTTWYPIPDAPVLEHLQDPCIAFINGELIVGGVRYPIALPSGENIWRMEFYRGKTLRELKLFFTGPDKMKDIRLKQLADGRIAVLTRPQGEKGGRGTIGWLVVSTLEAITVQAIEDAPLFSHHFLPSEWGGANEAHLLRNGKLGVLGHIAYFDAQEHRHYYPMVFCVDPATGTATPPQIIGQRSDFPAGATKRPDLVDVIFSGGLVRNGDGSATLYAGLSDAEAGWITIPDPFLSFEVR